MMTQIPMYTCGRCQIQKPANEFHSRSRKSRPVYAYCKTCRTVKDANRRSRIRAILWEVKNRPCYDCGKHYHPFVMDFDHVRGTKRFDLSSGGSRDENLLREEIDKCDVVCANCHRLRTWNRKQFITNPIP